MPAPYQAHEEVAVDLAVVLLDPLLHLCLVPLCLLPLAGLILHDSSRAEQDPSAGPRIPRPPAHLKHGLTHTHTQAVARGCISPADELTVAPDRHQPPPGPPPWAAVMGEPAARTPLPAAQITEASPGQSAGSRQPGTTAGTPGFAHAAGTPLQSAGPTQGNPGSASHRRHPLTSIYMGPRSTQGSWPQQPPEGMRVLPDPAGVPTRG